MKLDLAAHEEDAHGAIKTADGRLVVPFVLLLASLKGDRPWRVAVQYLAQRLGSAWPQSWYWLRPGDHPEDMADWLKQQHELVDYQKRQEKSGMGAVAFMATELNQQIKSGQIRRKAKRLEWPLPGDAEDLRDLLECRLFDAAALERATGYEALRAGDHGRAAIDLEDVRRVFPELEIVGLPPPAASWQERALELASSGMKPTAIFRELGLVALLGVKEEAARNQVARLIAKNATQEIDRKKAEGFKRLMGHLQGSGGR